jgi:hypothetical protein
MKRKETIGDGGSFFRSWRRFLSSGLTVDHSRTGSQSGDTVREQLRERQTDTHTQTDTDNIDTILILILVAQLWE